MARKLMQVLALEDDAIMEDVLPESELVKAEDLVTALEDEEVMNDAFADAEATAEVVEDSAAQAEETDEVIEEQAEKLESAEPVTPVEAVVATEALRTLADAIGMRPEAISGMQVSHEAAERDPRLAYSIAHEGFKEVAKTIAESIKKLFQALMVKIKSLMSTVLVALNSSDKAAKGLLDKANKATFSPDAKWEDAEVKKWAGILPVVAAVSNGTIGKDGKGFDVYLRGIADPLVVSKFAKLAVAKYKTPGTDVSAEFSKPSNQLEKSMAEFVDTNVVAFVKKSEGQFSPFGFDGSSLKGLVLIPASEGAEATIAASTLTFAPNFIEKVAIEFPTKEGVIKILKDAIINIANTKAYADTVRKAADEVASASASAAGSVKEEDKEAVKAFKAAEKISRVYGTSVAITAIGSLVKGTRATISYASAALNKATSAKPAAPATPAA